MELTFSAPHQVASGVNPDVAHMDDNKVYLFRVESGQLKYAEVDPGNTDVDWDTVTFSNFALAKREDGVSLVRLKRVPRLGLYGSWKQDQIMDGEVEITPERHRFAIWNVALDVSKYLNRCVIEMRDDSPIMSMTLSLENPSFDLVGEDEAEIIPGNRIEFNLTMGDSEAYPMGVLYSDRTFMVTSRGTLDVEGRSITGKLLKDQQFNTNDTYPYQPYALNIVALLENAGITDYSVQVGGTWEYGIQFPRDTDMLSGLLEMLSHALHWKVVEDMDGKVIAGSTETFADIQRNSRYVFNRGSDVFSRAVERDDVDVYAQVCCHCELTTGGTQYSYATVTNVGAWDIPPNKTLYVELPKDTAQADADAIAADVAERVGNAGVVETFIGPIRPHLLPGDEAEVVTSDGSRLLGTITSIRHSMGISGYTTEFTVDSGGRVGKPRITDYISSLSGSSSGSKGIRLY